MNGCQSRVRGLLVLGLMALAVTPMRSYAGETVYILRADVTTVTMPDGRQIPMWGFAQDSSADVDDGVVTVPGPRLDVPPGDSLIIRLKNRLTAEKTGLPTGCPVSLIIPGQPAHLTPVRFGATPYPEYAGRIRSLTYETPPGNSIPMDYAWTDLRPGTFIYHSATHIQCHVQMGLYGAMTKNHADGEAYPGVLYDEEVLFLYSEIDPEFHAAVAEGRYGPGQEITSTIDYEPQYFLINGKPYAEPFTDYPKFNWNPDTGMRILFRFLNAGLQSHAPNVNGMHLDLIAEDGFPYEMPLEQYAISLPAGKTLDAVVDAQPGTYPILDRTLDLTNGSSGPGGMLTFVKLLPPMPPETAADAYTVDEDNPLNVSAPGVLGNDWDENGDPLEAVQVTGAAHGTLTLNADGSFDYVPEANYFGADSFTYKARDPGGLESPETTVSITVNPVNDAPVAENMNVTTDEDVALNITLAATDIESDPLTFTYDQPEHGTLTGTGPDLVYTPDPDYFGPDSFSYFATDGQLASANATVGITVNPVNDAPMAADDAYAVDEDNPLVVAAPGVLGNDSDIDGPALQAVLDTTVVNGDLVFDADGSFTYSPNPNFNGVDTFTYRVTDGTDSSATATVSITVNPINDPPEAQDLSGITDEDVPLNLTLTATDIDGDALTFTYSQPAHGSVTGTGPNVVYTPAAHYSGPDSFTFTASDAGLTSNVATVSITVIPINHAPTVMNDAYATDDNTVLNVVAPGVLGNDTDPDGDPMVATLVAGPKLGTVNFLGDGSFDYTPGPDYLSFLANPVLPYGAGQDFNSTFSVENGGSTLRIRGNGWKKIALPYTVTADTVLEFDVFVVRRGEVHAVGFDTDDVLSPEWAFQVYGTQAWGLQNYRNYPGTGWMHYSIPVGQYFTGTFASLTFANDHDVTNPNAETVFRNVRITEAGYGALSFLTNPVLPYGAGQDFNSTFSVESGGSALRIRGNGWKKIALPYTVTADTVLEFDVFVVRRGEVHAVGFDTDDILSPEWAFQVYGTQAWGLQNYRNYPGTGWVHYSIPVGQYFTGTFASLVFANDHDVTNPNAETVFRNVRITEAGQTVDRFTYVANDGIQDSAIATVTVTVTAANDPPVAAVDSYSVDEDGTLTVPAPGLLANDFDEEGDPLTVVLDTGTSHGTLTLNANGSFDYTPEPNYFGTDSFAYTANDGVQNGNTATVTITVTPVADAPVASDDAYTTEEDTALNVAAPGVLGNDSDVDGDPLTVVLATGPLHGTLALNPDGSFDYTPEANYTGTDSFTYTASDGTLDSNTATVSISVGAVNDAPVAEDQTAATDEDVALNLTLVADDADGDPLSYSYTQPAHGALTGLGPNLVYTPEANYTGPDSFTFTANDGTLDSNTATVSVSVGAVNDAPVASGDAYATDEDTALNVAAPGVLGNDSDVDGDPLTVVLATAPVHGTLVLNPDGSFDYTPDANYAGPDSFTYTASDGTLDSNTATVDLTVNAVNEAPTASGDAYATDEDTVLNVAAPGVLGNDSDVDGDPLTVVLTTGPLHGALVLNPDGSFDYTPEGDYAGPDSFTYTASDGTLDSNVATVDLTVNPVNDAPVAQNQTAATDEDVVLNLTVVANDADGDPLSYSYTQPVHGAVTGVGPDLVYTPEGNYTGPDSFTFTANDGTLDSNTATVSISVGAMNDAPVASDDAYTTDEDTVLNIAALGVLGNDSDLDGDSLTVVLATGPVHGTLLLNPDGSFDYTPEANYTGPDSFTYTASDGTLDSNTATVDLTVNPVNDAPVASTDAYATDEDTALNVAAPGVLGNDSDVDGDPLTVVLVTGPVHGTLVLNPDASFDYTPDANYAGPDSFTYTASDGTLSSAAATVDLTVNAVNDAPVAQDQTVATDEGVALNLTLVANDADGDPLSYSYTQPAHGSVTGVGPDLVYTPEANYAGPDGFTFTASDGTLDSNIATVSVSVGAVNDAPVANADAYATDEDTALNVAAPGVLGNDSDVDGDPLTVVLVTGPAHGTLLLNPDGSFDYTPDANYAGPDSFTYTASDATLDSNIATVDLTVNAVNDAAVASTDAYTTDEDTALNVAAPGVLANDFEVDGDPLNVVLVTGPVHGTLLLNPDGSFDYTPDADYAGPDGFTYTASDGTLSSAAATVDLTVTPVNDAPVAQDQTAATDEDVALNLALVANDADGDPLSYSYTQPAHGSVTGVGPDLVYTPEANYAGPDGFTFTASDGTLDSNIATVSVSVGAVNDAPVANADAYATDEDTALNVAAPGVLGNDSDVDGDPLTATLVVAPLHGALVLNPDGSFDYTPEADYTGPDSFTYTANDGTLDSNVATVSISVGAVNDAPVASDDAYTTDEDTVLNIAAPGVLGNDSDLDGDPLTVVLATGPLHGTLALNPDGSFDYTPEANYTGPDSFTYTASDGTLDSNVATVSISVGAVNDAPVASDDAYTTDEDTVLNIAAPGVLGNDSDLDGDPLTVVLATGPLHGTLALNPDGSFDYTPDANYTGPDSFTYTASDGTLDSNTATVDLTVNAVNEAPVASGDAYATDEDTALNIAAPGVLGNDSDLDGDPLTVVLATGPLHGTLALNPDGSFDYTPEANYTGPDSFTYTASDGTLGSNTATVDLTVTPVNDAPLAVADAYFTEQDVALIIAAPGVLANDSDVDGDLLTVVPDLAPTHGTLVLNPDGSFDYTPDAGYAGPDGFTYTVGDGVLSSGTASVDITVNPVP